MGGCELAGGTRVTVGIVEPRIELVGGGGSGMGLDSDTDSDSDAIADVVAVLVEVECEGFEWSEVVEVEDDVSSDGTSERWDGVAGCVVFLLESDNEAERVSDGSGERVEEELNVGLALAEGSDEERELAVKPGMSKRIRYQFQFFSMRRTSHCRKIVMSRNGGKVRRGRMDQSAR